MTTQQTLFDDEIANDPAAVYQDVLVRARRIAARVASRWAGAQDADDLAQQAMERYWKTFGAGEGPASLSGWLSRTIENLAVDESRRVRGRNNQRQWQSDMDLRDDQLIKHPDLRELSPSWEYVSRDTATRVLARLSERDREVFRLRVDGVPAAEVAALLGLRRSNVDQIFKRTRDRLLEILAADPALHEALRDTLVMVPMSASLPTPGRELPSEDELPDGLRRLFRQLLRSDELGRDDSC